MKRQDLSKEVSRTYHYDSGEKLVIDNPSELYWKQDNRGDSHRILTSTGEVFYPKRGWLAISWIPEDMSEPVQF